ncbi:AraC family transcriptional regulator [Salipaludibacillus sp. LMS25]|jgi:YesN/AraC family two-component response regulator|uniref:helix-turn-helix transcriptional regulator n=1 Tax=Salipaludibacillus sp. LMS25 TaxID=2924031 RepID=UPI0020D02C50|nr:AraC family transcriptional regulator [Salipaludibacillus sp. LMS25]UTR15770.1 AraC family transcriptional regulator [Salipaludibacillus sp. LMS25]
MLQLSEWSDQDCYPFFTFFYYKHWKNYEMAVPHTHEAIEIMYVLDGRCLIETEHETILLREGQYILLDSYVPHRLIATKTVSCRMLNIEFIFKEMTDIMPSIQQLSEQSPPLKHLCQLNVPYIVLDDMNDVGTVLRNLVLELDKKETVDLKVQLLTAQLLVHVAEAACDRGTRHGATNRQQRYITQAIQYMHQHYDHPVTVADIAQHVHLNEAYLQRLFKREMSCTVMSYLTSFRIKKAKMLLRHSSVPITEIASYIGLNSRQHFSFLFKKHCGCSPNKYRQNIESDII